MDYRTAQNIQRVVREQDAAVELMRALMHQIEDLKQRVERLEKSRPGRKPNGYRQGHTSSGD